MKNQNYFKDKNTVVRYDILAEKKGVLVTDIIESVKKVRATLRNNKVIADMYMTIKDN